MKLNPIQFCLFRFLSVLTINIKIYKQEFVNRKFDWARLSSVRFCSIVDRSAIQHYILFYWPNFSVSSITEPDRTIVEEIMFT